MKPLPTKLPRGTKELLAQRHAIVNFGRMALQNNDLDKILNEACRLTREALGTELSKIMRLQDQGRSLLVVAGIGWRDGIVGSETVPALERSSEGYALKTGRPAISEDIHDETRFDYAEFLKQHGVQSMVNVVIPGPDGEPPYGLLQVDSTEPRDFTPSDIEFLQGYANLVGAAIERSESQRRLGEALQVQERLLHELAHRVSNNLGVIMTLLRVKAHRAQHPAVKQDIADVISRVNVLHEIYDKLRSSTQADTVDLGGYLASLCSSVVAFNGRLDGEAQLETAVEPVLADTAVAVPLGLVTNEFVTNSIKHAGGDRPLTIRLALSEQNGEIVLSLSDNGPGLGDAFERREERHRGSGLMLIEGLLNQIGSTWSWSGDGGTSLEVHVGLAKLAVSGSRAA